MIAAQKKITNILLVEDDSMTASLQTIKLQKFGYNIIIAPTGETAVDIAAKRGDIDIILMDIDLGDGIDGTEAAEKILKNKDIPVLFLSNHIEPEIVEKTEKITSYGYVVKNTGDMVLNASIKMAFKLHDAQKREKEKEKILKQRTEELSALYEISKNINFTISEKKTVNYALKCIMKAVKPSIAFIFFRDKDKLILQDIKYDKKENNINNMPEHKVGKCLCGLAVKGKTPIFSLEISTDNRCVMEECKKANFRSFAALPLYSPNEIIGVVGLASKTTRDFEIQKEFLESAASEISVSLLNVRLLDALQKELKERKLNEKILSESEKKYRILFEKSAHGIVVTNIETKKFLFANPAICKLYGYTEKEFLKLTVNDIHPNELFDKIKSDFEELKRKKNLIIKAMPCLHKNKKIFYVDIITAFTVINGINCTIAFFTDITKRLKVEQSLIESEKRYKMVSDLTTDYFFIISVQPDYSLNLEFVSDSFGKITGRSITKAKVFEQWKKIFHPDDMQNVMLFIKKLISGQSGSLECRTFIKGETMRWVEITANPEFDEKTKKVITILGVVKNITARKEAELSLLDAKNFAENLIRSANIMFVEVDLKYNIIQINKEAEKITGYKNEEVVGKNWFEIMVPKTRFPYIWEKFRNFSKIGEIPKIFENPIITKTGEERVIVWKNNFNIKNNDITEIIAFGIDITDRKHMEEELKKSESRYRMIVENVNDVFYIHDFKGKILDLNANASKLLGYSREEMLSGGLHLIDTPENAKKMPERMDRLIKDGSVIFEGEHLKKDNSKIFVSISAKVVSYEGNGIVQSFVRDITEKKNIENDLSRALEEKNALLRELQHRIKNTLAMITSLADLEADSSINPEVHEALVNIRGKIDTLSNLYSMLYSSENIKDIQLDKYLKTIADSILFAYKQPNKEIQLQMNLQILKINVKQASSIGLILNELVTNSFKYAFINKIKGTIKVELIQNNEAINLLISDNGSGIPDGLNNIHGGFGLKLVKILTEQLNAKLSYSQNKWNTFKIKIPLQ